MEEEVLIWAVSTVGEEEERSIGAGIGIDIDVDRVAGVVVAAGFRLGECFGDEDDAPLPPRRRFRGKDDGGRPPVSDERGLGFGERRGTSDL